MNMNEKRHAEVQMQFSTTDLSALVGENKWNNGGEVWQQPQLLTMVSEGGDVSFCSFGQPIQNSKNCWHAEQKKQKKTKKPKKPSCIHAQ